MYSCLLEENINKIYDVCGFQSDNLPAAVADAYSNKIIDAAVSNTAMKAHKLSLYDKLGVGLDKIAIMQELEEKTKNSDKHIELIYETHSGVVLAIAENVITDETKISAVTISNLRKLFKTSQNKDCVEVWKNLKLEKDKAQKAVDVIYDSLVMLDHDQMYKDQYENRKAHFENVGKTLSRLRNQFDKYLIRTKEDKRYHNNFYAHMDYLSQLTSEQLELAKGGVDFTSKLYPSPVATSRKLNSPQGKAIHCMRLLSADWERVFGKPQHNTVATLINAMFGTNFTYNDVIKNTSHYRKRKSEDSLQKK